MKADKRSAWLRKLDEECPYQVVLPRRQLSDDNAILDFLLAHVGYFDMYNAAPTPCPETSEIATPRLPSAIATYP